MKILKLEKGKLDLFASVVQQFGEVHAPTEHEGKFSFKRLNSWSEARLDYNRTVLPPRKYFLPPRETLFKYREATGYVPATEDLEKRVVLFGVHACDIHALNILDEVFGKGYLDPYYLTRRKNITIIGIDCTPDEHCFCRSMRADFAETGFDLFLKDIGDHYLTFVGTARGDDMVIATGPLFSEVTHSDIVEYKRRSSQKCDTFKLDLEIRDLPEIFELEYQADIWEELGEKCLSCGNCSMVCPTCYCYDVADEVKLGSHDGDRVRLWDSCLFATHALVAGGENFRKTRSSRIKFRFYHKQRGFVAEYGRPSCVGCGRCIEACPVGINIVGVINRLRGVEHASTD
ncbi:MAG: 4Fe-4S dicluster domain-containing protein [Candidatus Krumholzibacteria bacterium]|nr:4Fe-4S dicluster domain-containing protein [Candidatus Krumholzibacteria bacterium]